MLNKTTSDGAFEISKCKIGINDIEEMGINLCTTDSRRITLVTIAHAIEEYFSEYDVGMLKPEQTFYVIVMIKYERRYEFKVNWKPRFEDYLITIANQIEL